MAKKINRKFFFTIVLLTILASFFIGKSSNYKKSSQRYVSSVFKMNQSSGVAVASEESSFLPMKFNANISVELKLVLEKHFKQAIQWPERVELDGKKLKVEYAFNSELTDFVKKLLKTYHSDYSTVVVIDNETGNVLTAVGHEGRKNDFDNSLVLTSTHPSASLIKIVTAAELLRSAKISKETEFVFRGKSTTLYKYQLNDTKNNRWDKIQTFEDAFAKSNNVIFGKAAIKNIEKEKLIQMAENFGFNKPIMQELSYLKSYIPKIGNDDYQFAEVASGFNSETVISPIHAAAMASIVANDGILRAPRLITKILDEKSGERIWENSPVETRALSPVINNEMKEIMRMTVEHGTAKKSFRRMHSGFKEALDMGGKTGSITGGQPFGKRDWYATFAIPRDKDRGKGISISVMNVNVKKWYVRSTHLAKEIIEYYYNNIKPVPITMAKNSRFVAKRVVRKKDVFAKGSIASQRTMKKIRIAKRQSDRKKIGKLNERKPNTRF